MRQTQRKWALRILGLGMALSCSLAPALTPRSECDDDLDLSDQLGPVRNQGDQGWCYANAAADLLTAKLKTKNLGTMSAIQLAMIYNLNYSSSLMVGGGQVDKTLTTALRPLRPRDYGDELLKFGYCPASMESALLNSEPGVSLSSKLANLNKLKQNFDLGRSNPLNQQKFWDDFVHAKANGFLGQIPESSFLRVLERSSPANFLLRFADLLCGEQRYYNENSGLNVITHARFGFPTYRPPRGASCEIKVEFDLLPDIHRELKAGNVVGIAFPSRLIAPERDQVSADRGHAATLVGRRWRNGKCQLKLRNSWGANCETLDPVLTKVVSRYSKKVQECVGGNLWINEADLAAELESLTYLVKGQDPDPQVVNFGPETRCPQAK